MSAQSDKQQQPGMSTRMYLFEQSFEQHDKKAKKLEAEAKRETSHFTSLEFYKN